MYMWSVFVKNASIRGQLQWHPLEFMVGNIKGDYQME